MNLTLEELQKAGASPELARILADRLSRRARRDLTSNPMVVALSGIFFAGFLSTFAWLALGVTGLQTEVALLDKRVAGIEEQMRRLDERMTGLEGRMTGIETRMAGIEEKLDRLLQQ